MVIFLKNFDSFCPGTSRETGVCHGTFAPALVPGQRDTRTRYFFLSWDKGTTGRPIPWKPYLKARKLPARYICQCRLMICQCKSFAFQRQKNGCLHNLHDNHILFDQSSPRYKTEIDSECTRCQLSQKECSQIAGQNRKKF